MSMQEQQLRESYSAVRRRLMTPPVRPVPVVTEPPPVVIPEVKVVYLTPSFTYRPEVDITCPAYRQYPHVIDIFKIVAKFYGVTLTDMKSARRDAAIVLPRHVAIYLARTMTTRSLPFIARQMGNRDHTTILFSARKITALLETDAKLKGEVDHLRALIETRPA